MVHTGYKYRVIVDWCGTHAELASDTLRSLVTIVGWQEDGPAGGNPCAELESPRRRDLIDFLARHGYDRDAHRITRW